MISLLGHAVKSERAWHGGTHRAGDARWTAKQWSDGVRLSGVGSDLCQEGANLVPLIERTLTVKYMILTFASQKHYQELVGQPSEQPAWTKEDWAALGTFMQTFNQELLGSGELVETRGLSAPVHTRRVRFKGGAPVVTDGPYAEAEEVLAGYWVVECESFDRATEIASRLAGCPGPDHVRARAYADVRPIDEHQPDFEG